MPGGDHGPPCAHWTRSVDHCATPTVTVAAVLVPGNRRCTRASRDGIATGGGGAAKGAELRLGLQPEGKSSSPHFTHSLFLCIFHHFE
eukprot:PDM73856.1 hypothetical protein PRIPAC_41212 [Pristionchus pacificus]